MIYVDCIPLIAQELGLYENEARKLVEYFEGANNNINLFDLKYLTYSWEFDEIRGEYNIPITIKDNDLAKWLTENISDNIYIQCDDTIISIE